MDNLDNVDNGDNVDYLDNVDHVGQPQRQQTRQSKIPPKRQPDILFKKIQDVSRQDKKNCTRPFKNVKTLQDALHIYKEFLMTFKTVEFF